MTPPPPRGSDSGSGRPRRDGQSRPGQPGTGRPSSSRPQRDGDAPGARRDGAGAARPRRDDSPGSRRDTADGSRPRRDSGDRPARRFEPSVPGVVGSSERRAGARKLNEPELPEGTDPKALDRAAKAGLRSLPISLAETVAAHLVAAGNLLEDSPEQAHRHTSYARQLAPRLAVVREAVAVTSYATGDYAAALAELRALRRMTGDSSYLPVMADCERGLGRPERAIALSKDPAVQTLDPASRVELAIVVSGARRDRGEAAAAVALLAPQVESKVVRPWTPRLWYAYADALLDAGRRPDALHWFEAAAEVDGDELTDAADRAEMLRRNNDGTDFTDR